MRPLFLLFLLTVSCVLQLLSPAFAVQAWLNPYGYHPKALKLIKLQQLPNGLSEREQEVALAEEGKTYWPILPIGKQTLRTRLQNLQPLTGKSGPNEAFIDLTAAQDEGLYKLEFAKPFFRKETAIATPIDIKINSNVYWQQLGPAVRSLYLHRSGSSIDDPLTGTKRYSGHLNDAAPYPKGAFVQRLPGPLDLRGGWYEGNRYEKNTVSHALATGLLLSVYQQAPDVYDRLSLQYPLKERARLKGSDWLNETRYGLTWLLKMQSPSGLFYEKVDGTQAVSAKTPPWRDRQKRYFYPAAMRPTAAATATLALAAQSYQKSDMTFSVRCLRAAQKGWQALLESGQSVADTDGLTSWAAAALYQATNESEYEQALEALVSHQETNQSGIQPNTDLEYSSQLGHWLTIQSYLHNSAKSQNHELRHLLSQRLITEAKRLSSLSQHHPYGLPEAKNSHLGLPTLVRRATLLSQAYQLTGDGALLAGADATFNWVLGVNPWHRIFLSGDSPVGGLKRIQQPCYLLSTSQRQLFQGLLVNGPMTGFTQLPFYNDSPHQCPENTSHLLSQVSWVSLLGSLNHSYNPPSEASVGDDAEAVLAASSGRKRQKLPPL